MRTVIVLALALALAGCGSASASGDALGCLKASGAKTSRHGPEVAADWRSNSVSVWRLPSHAVAVAYASAGTKAGKPASENLVVGSALATFWKIPTRADLARVHRCMA